MFIHASNILTNRNRVFNVRLIMSIPIVIDQITPQAMAGFAKAPAALADIIATSSLCYSLGYARTGIRACVTHVLSLIRLFIIYDCVFQHGLGPQETNWIRDPTRCFGILDPDCVFDHLLRVIFALVLVC